jgi:hypothetical protein
VHGRASKRKNRLGGNPLQLAATKYRTRPGSKDEYVPISEYADGKYPSVTIAVTIDDTFVSTVLQRSRTQLKGSLVLVLAGGGDARPIKKEHNIAFMLQILAQFFVKFFYYAVCDR